MDEQELIVQFQAGDIKADRVLFDEFYQELCYFTERLAKDRDEGQKIVIDVYEKLFQKRNDFGNVANIKAFLYVSCRNRCFNYLRSKGRHRKREKEFLDLQDDKFVEREQMEAKYIQQIRAAVESLPGQCRRVIEMIYFEERNYSEISVALGISESTVRNHKRNAIKLLRDRLGPSTLLLGAALFYCGILQYFLSQPQYIKEF